MTDAHLPSARPIVVPDSRAGGGSSSSTSDSEDSRGILSSSSDRSAELHVAEILPEDHVDALLPAC